MLKQESSQAQVLVERIKGLDHPRRQALFRKLAEKGVNLARLPIVPLSEREGLPLSYAQQRQWFLWQLEPDSAAYNMPTALRLKGELDLGALQRSFDALVARHEPLRTTFVLEDGQPRQCIHPQGRVVIEHEHLPGADEALLAEAIGREAQRPFDLEHGPLLRVRLLELGEDDRVLVLTQHHIVSDGWSMQLMVEELITLYQGFRLGHDTKLPPLAIQYADYAAWQRQWMEAGERERQLAYWTAQLGGEQPLLELPADRPRPALRSAQGARLSLELDGALFGRLKQLAQREGCSPFMLLLASFQLLLQRYCGQGDIRVGVPSANRNRAETERLLGFFVNTQVLRAQVENDASFIDLLQQNRQAALAAQAHQDLPFEQLVDALQPERSLSHSPLFQVMFNYQVSAGEMGGLAAVLPGLQVEPVHWAMPTTQFDLSLDCTEHPRGLSASLIYATDLFDAERIQRMAVHWQNLLAAIAEQPRSRLGDLPMLTDSERERAILGWNHTARDYPGSIYVHQLFEQRALSQPNAPALTFAGRTLSYAELNAEANRLAHHLRSLGVGQDVLVGIAAERSVEMVVGLLAILKAGGAYVPLDPEYPQDRLAYMFEDSGIALLLTQSHLRASLPIPAGLPVLELDQATAWAGQDETNPGVQLHPESLAYVIYTSGSTGKPKGAGNRHTALHNRLAWMQEAYQLNAEDSVLQKTPFSFDVSVWEFFWPLMEGARLVMALPGDHRDPARLVQLITDEQITTLHFVPSMLQAFVGDESAARCTSLRRIVCSGEALPVELQRQTLALLPQAGLYNLYGPTEAAIDVTHWTCIEEGKDAVPIGQPIANLQTYVLDAELNPVSPGVTGELYLGGLGLARGYHRRPALTAERFVTSPFGNGERLYRTGDLARQREDGVIEYAGRIDHQVKIRGLRIELGEIEARLQEQDAVREAVVVAADGPSGKQLLAYLVPEPESLARAEAEIQGGYLQGVKARLLEVLPDYMVPAQWLLLERMPLSPNGKLDRKALPKPDPAQARSEYQAPRNELEQRLALIWQDVLRLEQVGVDDNFFELGGDSIISIQIVSRARQAGIRIAPRDLFQHQSIRRLATVAQLSEALQVDQGPVTGEAPLLPIQQAFFDTDIPNRHHWNQSLLLAPSEPLDAVLLTAALAQLLQHHDALRLRYRQVEGAWVQAHAEAAAADELLWCGQLDSLDSLPAFCSEVQRSLDLAAGPMLRLALIELPDGGQRLLLAIHHLVVDGVSWRILLEDLQTAYRQLQAGETPRLPAKTTSFKAWGERLRDHARSDAMDAQLGYWQQLLQDAPVDLPRDNPAGALDNRHARSVATRLDATRTRQLLQDAPAAYRTQVNDLLLTALAQAVCAWTGEASALVQLEGHGREDLFEDIDLSRTVGWFTSLFPVRLEPAADIGTAIKHIKEQLRSTPDKGLGHGLLRHLGSDEARATLAGLPQPRITFNYLGQFDGDFAEGALWVPAEEGRGAGQDPQAPLGNWLSVDGQVFGGELSLNWTFSGDVFAEATIARLAEAYQQALEALIEHCCDTRNAGLTPSDVPLAGLDQAQLDALALPAREVATLYPLSPMQQGMLFHSLYEASGRTYVNQMRLDIRSLDVARFASAWQQAVDRHELLRAGFIWDAGLDAPRQVIHRQAALEIRVEEGADATALDARAAHELDRGFDLARPPLLRLCLLRTGDDSHHLIYTSHHILMDGWSNSRLLGEVLQAYAGQDVAAPEGRYQDYLAWLQRQDRAASERFWLEQLAPLEEPTRLALACGRVASPEPGQALHSARLDAGQTRRLQAFARQQQVTLNTLVQSAWLLLLQRYSGQRSVAFGATVSGRPVELPGIEQQLGLFINTLPVIATPDGALSVAQWAQAVQAQNLALRDHEHMPLADVQRLAGRNGEALFDTLLVFENYPVSEALEAAPGGLGFSNLLYSEQSGYALTLIAQVGEELELAFNYLTADFAEPSIRRIAGQLVHLLLQFMAQPQRALGELHLLEEDDHRRVVEQWNATARDYPGSIYVHQLFEQRALSQPNAPALTFAGRTLSYAELNAEANRLAHHLRSLGVGPDVLVGIAAERSVEMVVGLMAILKAGGAYVPLDPEYPQDRLAYMFEDSGIALLLTQSHLRDGLPIPAGLPVLELDRPAAWASASDANPEVPLHPENLAYVIYTSGSTGKPKGAGNRHIALHNRLAWMQEAYQLSAEDSVLQKTPFSFDVSVWEFFWPLMEGARLVMALPGDHRDPARLVQLITEEGISTLHFVPSMLQAFVGEESAARCTSLRRIVCSGEALPVELQRQTLALLPQAGLYNLYGPTEAAIDVTHWTCIEEGKDAVPIGQPIANLQTYVLDAELNPVSPGVTGELYLGGIGLARGYHRRPALTAERFVTSPFGEGERLYRTGDLARQREDGVIEYAGRIDHQVKIRGLRIELGEIEARLQEQDAVREAVVVAADGPSGKQLVAYLVPEQADALDAIKAHLAAVLPDYMVPSQWVLLERMPLSPNGKLDRKALPKPDMAQSNRDYVAPESELEQRLAAIWQEVLRVERVGLNDNFFELGGDSIVSIQIASRSRQAGLEVSPRLVFENQTIAQLAAALAGLAPAIEQAQPITRVEVSAERRAALPVAESEIEDVYPLSPMQQGMLFHTLEDSGEALYINQVSLPVAGLDLDRFADAWAFVTARHDVLRTSFHWQAGDPLQVVHRHAQMPIRVLDWRDRAVTDEALKALAREEALQGFDLARAPLQRMLLVHLGESRYQMIWTSHHILMDGWSSSNLFAEVLERYAGKPLEERAGHYGDFIAWLQGQDQGALEGFWRERLADCEPTALAQAVHPRHDGQGSGHHALYSNWDTRWTARMQQFCRQLRITPNTLIQGAWLLLLQRYTGQRRVAFGATVAGRPESLPHADSMLGLFINTLPVIQDLEPTQRLDDWLRQLQGYNLDIRAWSHAPLADVQRWSGLGGQALFDSIIVFENYPIDQRLREAEPAGLTFGQSDDLGVTNFPMDLAVHLGDSLMIEYMYLRGSFSEAAVEGIRQVMEDTLDAMLRQPEERLGNLQRLSAVQLQAVMSWSLPGESIHSPVLLPELIAQQAARRPEATALVCAGQRLSYGELERRANSLARELVTMDAGPETVVGVALDRSLELVVGLLAVMKAGAAYVPLDLEYPAERLAYMIEDSSMALLITRSDLRAGVPTVEGLKVVELDGLAPLGDEGPLPSRLDAGNLAYLIYTSGSTGRPKGVAVTHGPLSMHCQAIVGLYEMGDDTRELHFMSFAFDGAHERWLSTLSSGGTLVIRDGGLWTPEQTLHALHEHGITIACFPPAYLKQMAEFVENSGMPAPSVRIYCFGGDAVPEQSFEQVKAALRPQYFTNGYGPTETVVTPMLWKVPANGQCQAAYAPIGRAVGQRSLHVLDDNLNPLPVGFAGELYIGGEGVARGYQGRPELTAERFVPDPFGQSGARLYRTGDLVRLREDGILDYVGRIDHQVKVRGFRIELGEVEACLRRQEGVEDALVVARDAASGKQLIGYVVCAQMDAGEHLKAALRLELPDYMVPAQVIALPAFPITPNGKLDRKALPEPSFQQDAYVAPRDERERLLAGIWEEVLQVEQVGVTDNFFELGGDSILCLQVVSRVKNHPQLDLELKLRDLMRYPTIAGLCERPVEATSTVAVVETQQAVEGAFRLLPIQEWLFAEEMAEPHHFNQALMLKARNPLDLDALERALAVIERHHDALRLRFTRDGGRWMQHYQPEGVGESVLWRREATDTAELERLANEAQRSLDLASGPMWRALHVTLPGGEARLLLVIHHLVVDAVSWRVLLEDLRSAYEACCLGEAPRLPVRSSSYRAWVERLVDDAPRIAAEERDWWLAQLDHPVRDLPCDNPRGRNQVSQQAVARMALSSTHTARLLKEAPAAYGTQINDLLLTALARVLCRWSEQDSVLVQLEGHGREDLFETLDLSRTVGWFTSMFPVRLAPAKGLGDSVRAIQGQLAAIPNKGIGYGVLRHLGDAALGQRLAGLPQARVTFNYLGQLDQSFDEQALLVPAVEDTGDCYSPVARLANWLEIIGQVYDGSLALRCVYSVRRYRPETVQALMDAYRAELEALIDHCLEQVG
ncbi:non-ribosomal peptide synthase/polyketide synthase [Pseudomonas otitidis]|uniref:Non-ribosomal peptide synthase/polyketide synthase n=2 Tax=Metapseudomonas otitidis TaxID=319939 RepID=A0ABU3XJX7_9GAMM|nr:non-ribosomal peptide synthase/polyketide synthase [Pseudomonas otitidis]MDV3438226.1 non-ribosomal peptide synthase/polyketide synthase [Pseudomonas otitidis]